MRLVRFEGAGDRVYYRSIEIVPELTCRPDSILDLRFNRDPDDIKEPA